MTADDLERVKAAHARSLPLSAEEREDLLRRQFPNEPHLLEEVQRLLGWHDSAGEFLTTPLVHRLIPPSTHELKVRRVGPYELVRELGSGGSATVYLASRADDLFEKQVAIKLLNRLSSSDEVFRRFRREIQALARVEHTNIIRMLEAGTTGEALAYIVTDYVDGRRIDDFAGSLALPEKLRLFLKVCDGVAYAHSQAIVHRDLKPSNILVTRDGVPKLIDFGIAQSLERGSDRTETGFERMTIQYASPEQILREKEITIASDIYSLGVILYELVAKRLPYGGPAHEAASRILLDDPLPLPEAPRDLEAIIRKALRKNPEERYGSVTELGDDLRRFLDGLPVAVRGDGRLYRLRKLVGRRRLAVIAAVLGGLALLGLSIASVVQAREARQRALQVKQLLTKAFTDARYTPDGYSSLQQLRTVELARLSSLDALPAELKEDSELTLQRFRSLRTLAYVQGLPATVNLGQTEQARQNLERSIEFATRLVDRHVIPDIELAQAHIELGSVLIEMDRRDEAAVHFQKAQDLVGSDRTEIATRANLEIMAQRSRILSLRGFHQEALRLRKEIVERRRELFGRDPKGMAWEFAGSLCSYGHLLRQMGQVAEAERAYSEALPIIEADAKVKPMSLELRWHLARENEEFANVLTAAGKDTIAAAHLDRAIELFRSILSREPDAQSNQRALAVCLALRGALLAKQGDRSRALAFTNEAVLLSGQAAAHDPASARAKGELEEIQLALARLKT